MNEAELTGGIEVLGSDWTTRRDILRCPSELTRWIATLYRNVTRVTDPGIAISECEESGRLVIGEAILKATKALWLPEEATWEARMAVDDNELVRRFADRLHEVACPEMCEEGQ